MSKAKIKELEQEIAGLKQTIEWYELYSDCVKGDHRIHSEACEYADEQMYGDEEPDQEELEKINNRLSDLELILLKDWGLDMYASGFVELEYAEVDGDIIYVECVSGQVRGEDHDAKTLKINRKTLELL